MDISACYTTKNSWRGLTPTVAKHQGVIRKLNTKQPTNGDNCKPLPPPVHSRFFQFVLLPLSSICLCSVHSNCPVLLPPMSYSQSPAFLAFTFAIHIAFHCPISRADADWSIFFILPKVKSAPKTTLLNLILRMNTVYQITQICLSGRLCASHGYLCISVVL